MNMLFASTQNTFSWSEFDVNHLLPSGWKQEILDFGLNNAESRILVPTSITSRDSADTIPVLTVGGEKIKVGLPWLFDLYEGEFLNLGKRCVNETLYTASKESYAVNLNVQMDEMRYEGHVDSNPLEGLLYVTTHPQGAGGELIVSNNPNARNIEEILADCVRIYPESGKLIFFDARQNPHFVSVLKDPSSVRVVVAMNFYTTSCSELRRPPDLDKHLFGIERSLI